MSDPWDRPAGGPPEGRVPYDRAPQPPGPRGGSHDAGPGDRGSRARGGDPDPGDSGGGISGGRAAARAAAHGRGGSRRRGGSRAKRRSGGRRFLRIAAITVSLLVVVTAGAGWWFYQHLNGNITSVSLTNGVGKDSAGKEKADAFGRTPINILVMGSDGRTSTEDCKLGGGCAKTGVQSGGNADVEMVLHISADRSNATVMSIPRDTEVDVPACTDPKTGAKTAGYHGMINSALAYGQACQVATVHQLTNIPIDHFIQVDFSGVVSMSDAVGGVPVCVSGDVYDTYSHLKLSKGTHTLKGVGALEFLRSRHGFGDGSDLGRTYAQHAFLSSLIRKFKSAGTLTNPEAVYKLANAATKALTVDTGLGSVKKLIGLADDVNKVPSKRITFTTMQTAPDPSDSNRVVVGAGAQTLFSTIAGDQALTTAGGGKSAAAKATASPSATAVPASQVTVSVRNGTTVGGRAGDIAGALVQKGFNPATSSGNADATATTTLTYGPGQKGQAQTAAKALGLPSSHLKQGTAAGVTLVIGSDWSSGTSFPGGSGTASAGDTKTALANAHPETADKSSSCAEVSTYKTVEINGVPMTPGQAYAASPGKKDSDD
ncbi:LCP family protein [Streptomyces sp. NPDC088194]|uniref:LCP family protein n=1 Tax=Streptomyces sp. NPDC088194 TaxID=3154931 RepID=UPI00344F08D9